MAERREKITGKCAWKPPTLEAGEYKARPPRCIPPAGPDYSGTETLCQDST